MQATTPQPAEFAHVTTWVFDLDNTLYPPSLNLFAQVDVRMTTWIAHYHGIDGLAARALQKYYFQQHGTTLAGLMQADGISPEAFLHFVHDIDHGQLEPDLRLHEAISALPGDKYILTNGSRLHAQQVADRLGLSALFTDMFGIEAANFTPKPFAAAYAEFLAKYGIDPAHTAMFEDMARNLEVPYALGMKTVLVLGTPPLFGETRADWETQIESSDHIHHVTWDLAAFLTQIRR